MNAGSPHRSGFVALGGRPNVGKSTLLNRLVGHKIAAVTPKPQTTRRRILGIRHDPGAELLIVDMPGIHEPRGLMNKRMVKTARQCLDEGEVVVAIVEAAPELGPGDRAFLGEVQRELQSRRRPSVIAINKIDLVERKYLIPLIDQCARLIEGTEIVPISALTGKNVEELLRVIKEFLPEGPAIMPEDEYTGQTERMLAEEIIQEKVFLAMRQEIPFSTAVKVEEFAEDAEKKLMRISAVIVAGRESHKGMLIGARGQRLKEIGRNARLDLERMFQVHIFLKLTVKVDENWTSDPRKLSELGI